MLKAYVRLKRPNDIYICLFISFHDVLINNKYIIGDIFIFLGEYIYVLIRNFIFSPS